MPGKRVFVIGVGMTKFEKPGKKKGDYHNWAAEAINKALADASISFKEVEQACAGYCYGESTCGQAALYEVGCTGIPLYNVNNNCATGSTALFMAKQFIEGGVSECVLAFGFEKMQRGSLQAKWKDRYNPAMKSAVSVLSNPNKQVDPKSPGAPLVFGNAGLEHMKKYGTKPVHFAKIAFKNHKHSVNNPYSQFQTEYSLEQIQNSPPVYRPISLTKLQCCPTSDGSAAAILASEDFVRKHGLEAQAVEVLGMAMSTDPESSFKSGSMMRAVGYDMSKSAAGKVYKATGLGPNDVQVVELHDCFSANELITYEALGLCPEGGAGAYIDNGDNTYGGKHVVNPSGGLISKGHPLGATGLAQCSELVWQLRGQADKRQVANAKVALQHNLGLGGAAVVAMYRRGWPALPLPAKKPATQSRL